MRRQAVRGRAADVAWVRATRRRPAWLRADPIRIRQCILALLQNAIRYGGSNAGAPEVDGTGLGLPIVRAIAEAHGGHAGLSDHPGGGLGAWFDLPADRGLALVSSGAA